MYCSVETTDGPFSSEDSSLLQTAYVTGSYEMGSVYKLVAEARPMSPWGSPLLCLYLFQLFLPLFFQPTSSPFSHFSKSRYKKEQFKVSPKQTAKYTLQVSVYHLNARVLNIRQRMHSQGQWLEVECFYCQNFVISVPVLLYSLGKN